MKGFSLKIFLIVVVFLSIGISFTAFSGDHDPKQCPDLSGKWHCYFNPNDKSGLFGWYEISQEDKNRVRTYKLVLRSVVKSEVTIVADNRWRESTHEGFSERGFCSNSRFIHQTKDNASDRVDRQIDYWVPENKKLFIQHEIKDGNPDEEPGITVIYCDAI